MRMNVLKPPDGAMWGRFNDRTVHEPWQNRLVELFEAKLDNCTDKTAMEVAVKKEWLKYPDAPVTSVEGRVINDVPFMELSDIGKQELETVKVSGPGKKWGELWFLGGNHRRGALEIFVERIEDELKQNAKQIERIEASGEDKEEDLEELRSRAEKLTADLDATQQWVVKLYDRGTSDEKYNSGGSDMDNTDKIEARGPILAKATFRFISRNEANEQHPMTAEERLQEIVEMLKDAYEEDLDANEKNGVKNIDERDPDTLYPRFTKLAQETAKTYKDSQGHGSLCTDTSFALGLVMASRIFRHYLHAPWFNVKELRRMLDEHGAVSKLDVSSLPEMQLTEDGTTAHLECSNGERRCSRASSQCTTAAIQPQRNRNSRH